ncbi:unnamed protein product [Prorocentrum cordatum]|uniref:subtilisin n=1 Tax=Prorocentrum cordatum TaxID=2364126 RepID=A0ABN9TJS0_9DINO|nr:unnamed protein product [Polarella glacialis]
MARYLTIASLVGARGAAGLASAGGFDHIQTSNTTPTMSRDAFGREFFTIAGVPIFPSTLYGRRSVDGKRESSEEKVWMFGLKHGATEAELNSLVGELHPTASKTNPDRGELPFAEGHLTEVELEEVVKKIQVLYPGLVEVVEEDRYATKVPEKLDEAGGVSSASGYPWGIQDINADVLRGRGAGVNVYVLDTGIRTTHVLFGGRAFAGVDVTTGSVTVCTPSSTTCAADGQGHGTHCAGTVGAATYGVADGAKLWGVKILDDNGSGYVSWSILAEQWVLSSGLRPAVVSMSIGGAGNSQNEKASIDALVNSGVTVVVAAGNQNSDACNYNPAWIPSAITVAAYAQGGAKWSLSNFGSCVDVWAPGSSIQSTYHLGDTSWAIMSGTSMATPHVAGLAAIMYEANPSAGAMSSTQRWALLTASQRTGYVTGIPATPATVNLVALAPTSSPTPSPTPSLTPSPTPGGAAAVGDPHLQNIHGDRFDLMKEGLLGEDDHSDVALRPEACGKHMSLLQTGDLEAAAASFAVATSA